MVAGGNMTITTNAAGDTITFASSGGGGGGILAGGSGGATSLKETAEVAFVVRSKGCIDAGTELSVSYGPLAGAGALLSYGFYPTAPQEWTELDRSFEYAVLSLSLDDLKDSEKVGMAVGEGRGRGRRAQLRGPKLSKLFGDLRGN